MYTNKYVILVVVGLGLFGGLGLFFSVSTAKADDHSKDRAFLQDAIHKMDVAGKNKDADGYVAFTHPDFVKINEDGQETIHGKEELRKKISHLFTGVTSLSEVTTVTSIVFSKVGAIVSENGVTHATLSVNGQIVKLENYATFRDLWVKNGNGWLERKSRNLTSRKTIDGHPMPQPNLLRPNNALHPTPAAAVTCARSLCCAGYCRR